MQQQRHRRLDRAKKPNWRERKEKRRGERGQEKVVPILSRSLSLSLARCFSACFPDSEWREIPPRVWQAAATSASAPDADAGSSSMAGKRNSISNLGNLLTAS